MYWQNLTIATVATGSKRKTLHFLKGLVSLDALALYFFVGLAFLIMWPLSGFLGTSANNEGDDLQQMWSMGWVLHKLGQNPFSFFSGDLFNANIFYPYPYTLAYSDPLLMQALLAAPVLLLTGNLVLSYNLGMWLAFSLSGWTMYWLVKEVTGSRLGGLMAGVIFAFAPYKIGRMSQLNLLSTQWLPLCFLFLRRMALQDVQNPKSKVQSPKSSEQSQAAGEKFVGERFVARFTEQPLTPILFALFFVFNAFSSFYYFFFILPLLALYLIFFYAAERRWPSRWFWLKLVLAGLGALLVMLPTLLPYLQLAADQSAERSPREVEQFSANYRFYLAATDNNLLWGKILAPFGGSGGERKLFPGALALILAVVSLLAPLIIGWKRRAGLKIRSSGITIESRRTRERWFWLALGILALLMSFGLTLRAWGAEIPMPYRLFYDWLPGWKALRAAMRYGLFVLLAVAILAGFGTAYAYSLITKVSSSWLKARVGTKPQPYLSKAVSWGVGFVLVLGAFWEYRSDITYINPNILSNPPQVYHWLAEPGNAGAVLELPMAEPGNAFSIRDYYSTFNWQPLVGGQSGYAPPVYSDLYNLTKRLPDKEIIKLLQGMKVRWLVYHINDENTPLSAAEWEKLEPKLAATKELKLVRVFPQDQTRVYELASDPWLAQLLDQVPTGAEVVVSDYRRTQPTTIELAATFLRQRGYQIYGYDRAGYRFLNAPPPGRAVQYGLFSQLEDPTPYGFALDEALTTSNGLTLYRRKLPPYAAYDVARTSDLRQFSLLRNSLELEIGRRELKFNGQAVGSGQELNGAKTTLTLTFASLTPQTIKLTAPGRSETSLQLSAGVSLWQSAPLAPGDKVRLEPSNNQTFYLNRAELSAAAENVAEKLQFAGAANPAVLDTRTRQENGKFITTFNIFMPLFSGSATPQHTFTLDIYRRPWGTHPNGHFGNWSIALPGAQAAQQVEFSFDPISRQTTVTVNGNPVDVGSALFKPGDGDWSVFIALWRNEPQNPQADTQLGVARLYEFSLNEGKLKEMSLLAERQLIFQPPLAAK